jgi:hypothetical protein
MKQSGFLTMVVFAALLSFSCTPPEQVKSSRAGAKAAQAAPSAATIATPHPTSTPNDGVRRITIDETLASLKTEEAVVVDVRTKAEYDRGHIKGSLSIPRSEIGKRLTELPKDKLIVFYCA